MWTSEWDIQKMQGLPATATATPASASATARDGDYKNSLGLEALAIFAALAFVIRVLVDVAIRIRNGRSLVVSNWDGYSVNLDRLSQVVVAMIDGASLLYNHNNQHHTD
ncbi:hypothetical protein Pcinc_044336 [Petrolisthes cinctipes]|uniref:Uncharacterized protein n=1 Tax=Petrolisthes cinctipes TaxID=88211 RepID=A0AAE1EEE6_PETCI|nr:hypothetical protein Pcinc_044336 [Petrolisthes cinctipes]